MYNTKWRTKIMEADTTETPKDRIRRLAREWYYRNKDRVRERKLWQCHDYRRRKRAGRPPKVETRPERVMVFDIETGEMRREEPETELVQVQEPGEPTPKQEKEKEKKPQPETKIEPGKFLVRFD
jgi:hypothetical protein